jgi:hypothetical protein
VFLEYYKKTPGDRLVLLLFSRATHSQLSSVLRPLASPILASIPHSDLITPEI